jgi:hypothetical protein
MDKNMMPTFIAKLIQYKQQITLGSLFCILLFLAIFLQAPSSATKESYFKVLEQYSHLSSQDPEEKKQAALCLYQGLKSHPELTCRLGAETIEALCAIGEKEKGNEITKKLIAIFSKESLLKENIAHTKISTETPFHAIDTIQEQMQDEGISLQSKNYNTLRLASLYKTEGNKTSEIALWKIWEKDGKPLDYHFFSGQTHLSDFVESRKAT